MVFWDWKTGRIKSRLQAHSKVVIAHEWLPHESVGVYLPSCLADPLTLIVLLLVESDHGFLGRAHQTLGTCSLAVKFVIGGLTL